MSEEDLSSGWTSYCSVFLILLLPASRHFKSKTKQLGHQPFPSHMKNNHLFHFVFLEVKFGKTAWKRWILCLVLFCLSSCFSCFRLLQVKFFLSITVFHKKYSHLFKYHRLPCHTTSSFPL